MRTAMRTATSGSPSGTKAQVFRTRESNIVTAIAGYLQVMERMGKCVYQRNNTGGFKDDRNRVYRFGREGSPDFYVFLANGRTLHLEVKNEKGKQRESQVRYQEAVEKLGHE